MEKEKRISKKYSAEFKLSVILDLVQNNLNNREVIRKHWNTSSRRDEDSYRPTVRAWHHIYLEKGVQGLMAQRREKTSKPRKMPVADTAEENLLTENQRLKERLKYLEMENEYLKKLNALIQSEEEKNHRKRPR